LAGGRGADGEAEAGKGHNGLTHLHLGTTRLEMAIARPRLLAAGAVMAKRWKHSGGSRRGRCRLERECVRKRREPQSYY
jgi:hypothetical protein